MLSPAALTTMRAPLSWVRNWERAAFSGTVMRMSWSCFESGSFVS
jgi:hypothetical protein